MKCKHDTGFFFYNHLTCLILENNEKEIEREIKGIKRILRTMRKSKN